jgi:flagellin
VDVTFAGSINGVNTIRNLSLIKRSLDKTLQHLSSGQEDNKAVEGKVDSVVSERMRAQVGSLTQAIKDLERHAQKSQTAEKAVGELREQLKAMREVAAAAAEDVSASEVESGAYQEQISLLVDAYNRQRDDARFGDEKLLDGSSGSVAHVPAISGYDVTEPAAARESVIGINSELRGLDRTEFRIEAIAKSEYNTTIKSLEVSSQNLVAAESLIRDTDSAAHEAHRVKREIEANAGVAAQAQGNLVSEAVYKLLHT